MRVGVLLAGCGVQDGSEVYEAVLAILAAERLGADVQAMAPDVDSAEIVNHYTGGDTRSGAYGGGDARNVLTEAARIVRGKIISTREVSAHQLDALLIPGGYGVVKNLCTYAAEGVSARVNPDVERLIQEMNGLGKPIGAMCIAPVLVALALQHVGKSVSMTVGNDGEAALAINQLGHRHHATTVDEIHVDPANNIVSTAAFMLATTPGQAAPAINALVERVLGLIPSGPGLSGDLATTRDVTAHN